VEAAARVSTARTSFERPTGLRRESKNASRPRRYDKRASIVQKRSSDSPFLLENQAIREKILKSRKRLCFRCDRYGELPQIFDHMEYTANRRGSNGLGRSRTDKERALFYHKMVNF
jgi:hypothetical protein